MQSVACGWLERSTARHGTANKASLTDKGAVRVRTSTAALAGLVTKSYSDMPSPFVSFLSASKPPFVGANTVNGPAPCSAPSTAFCPGKVSAPTRPDRLSVATAASTMLGRSATVPLLGTAGVNVPTVARSDGGTSTLSICTPKRRG